MLENDDNREIMPPVDPGGTGEYSGAETGRAGKHVLRRPVSPGKSGFPEGQYELPSQSGRINIWWIYRYF